MNKYSESFLIAVHEILTGTDAAQIVAPNGDSTEWERKLYADLAAADNPKKRMALYSQYTVALKNKPQLDELIFNPPIRDIKHHVDFIGKKAESAFKSANYVDVLSRMGYSFRLCDLDDSIEVNKQPLTDTIESRIRAECRDVGLYNLEYIRDSYVKEAEKNHYNPIVDYLTAQSWDGRDWIGTLTGYISDDDNLIGTLLRRWLIGAVARIFQETQNRMLVLDGNQGIGKSSFVAWLASPLYRNFHAGEIGASDKDHKILLSNTWIWEVSELGSTIKRSDIEALKMFLSLTRIKERAPYGRHPIDKPAITSFIGTVNNIGGVLNDASGNRRFMATTINYINFDYVKDVDINQVWAQAYALYRNGERWNIEGEERTLVDGVNSRYETENPVVDLIYKKFVIDQSRHDDPEWFVPTSRLIELLHDGGWGTRSPVGDAMIIATACKKIGILKQSKASGGIFLRGYGGMKENYQPPS